MGIAEAALPASIGRMIPAMPASPRSCFTGVLALLGSVAAAQVAGPTPSPRPPAPLRLPFTALVPEVALSVAGASDFSASDDAVWIVSRGRGEVTRVDAKTSVAAPRLSVGKDLCAGTAADFGAVFLPRCAAGAIARLGAKTHAPGESIAASLHKDAHSVATGIGSLWVIADSRGTIARIDPEANIVVAEIHTEPGASDLVFGEGALWVANPEKNTVTRINPHNNLIVKAIPVAGGPARLAAGEGGIWTWNRNGRSVSRISARENKVEATIRAGPGSLDARIAAGEGSIWISRGDAPLSRIDPRTNHLAQVFTGVALGAIAVAHGSVWLAASPTSVWRLDPRRIEATRAGIPPRAAAAPSPMPTPSPSPTPTPNGA